MKAQNKLTNRKCTNVTGSSGSSSKIDILVKITVFLVNIIGHGVQVSLAILFLHNLAHFNRRGTVVGQESASTTWLVSVSSSVTLLVSPVIISVCKRKSTRLVAVVGGQ